MTSDDCARLVNLIVATWPTGPKAYIWTQALADLDAAPANRAYLDLRDTIERITIPAFRAGYDRAAGRARRRPDPDATCQYCRGCGFEPGPPEFETIMGEPHEYTTLQPCRCTRAAPAQLSRSGPVTPSLLDEEF